MSQLEIWKSIRKRQLSHSQYVTLLKVLRMANQINVHLGEWVALPVRRIAKEIHLTDRTVKKHLKHLKKCGYLDVQFNGCSVTTMVKILNPPKSE